MNNIHLFTVNSGAPFQLRLKFEIRTTCLFDGVGSLSVLIFHYSNPWSKFVKLEYVCEVQITVHIILVTHKIILNHLMQDN